MCAIIGGYVYRGEALPSLHGTYFFADYCGGAIWSLRTAPGVPMKVRDRTAELSPSLDGRVLSFIRSFAEDASGELYVLTGQELFKVVPRE